MDIEVIFRMYLNAQGSGKFLFYFISWNFAHNHHELSIDCKCFLFLIWAHICCSHVHFNSPFPFAFLTWVEISSFECIKSFTQHKPFIFSFEIFPFLLLLKPSEVECVWKWKFKLKIACINLDKIFSYCNKFSFSSSNVKMS